MRAGAAVLRSLLASSSSSPLDADALVARFNASLVANASDCACLDSPAPAAACANATMKNESYFSWEEGTYFAAPAARNVLEDPTACVEIDGTVSSSGASLIYDCDELADVLVGVAARAEPNPDAIALDDDLFAALTPAQAEAVLAVLPSFRCAEGCDLYAECAAVCPNATDTDDDLDDIDDAACVGLLNLTAWRPVGTEEDDDDLVAKNYSTNVTDMTNETTLAPTTTVAPTTLAPTTSPPTTVPTGVNYTANETLPDDDAAVPPGGKKKKSSGSDDDDDSMLSNLGAVAALVAIGVVCAVVLAVGYASYAKRRRRGGGSARLAAGIGRRGDIELRGTRAETENILYGKIDLVDVDNEDDGFL